MTEITALPNNKSVQRKGTRDKLLRAALSLLAEDRGGFAGLSLREITRRIGVSPTAFYRHFPGMEELGLTLIHESCETLREQLTKACQTEDLTFLASPPSLSTDNAAMIAFAAWHKFQQGFIDPLTTDIDPNLRLTA